MHVHERDKHLYSYQEPGLQSQCRRAANCRLNLCSCHWNVMPNAIRSLTHFTGVRCLQNQPHSRGRGQEVIHLHWCKSRLQTRKSSSCDICAYSCFKGKTERSISQPLLRACTDGAILLNGF